MLDFLACVRKSYHINEFSQNCLVSEKNNQIVVRLEFFVNLKNKIIRDCIMLSTKCRFWKNGLFFISKHSLLIMKEESFTLKGEASWGGWLKSEK